MEFRSAKLDRGARILTCVVVAFLVGLGTLFIFVAPFGWIFALIAMSIIVITYLWSPKRIIISDTSLIIEKHIGKKTVVPVGDIQGYRQIPDFAKLTVARTFGNGGLFGYYGIFSTAEYGDIRCELTRLKNIFLIKTDALTFRTSTAM